MIGFRLIRLSRLSRRFRSCSRLSSTSIVTHDSNHNRYNSTNGTNWRVGLAAAASISLFFDDDIANDHTKTDSSRLITAIKSHDVNSLKSLISSGVNVNGRHKFGWNPLHVAAFHGREQCVQMLLENGANVNATDEYDNLQTMARETGTHFLEILFSREQDFDHRLRNRQTFKGTTALHYAVLGDHRQIVKRLLEAGADPTICNVAGHSPLDYCKDDSMTQIIQEYTKKFEIEKARLEAEERRRYPLEQRIKEKIVGQEAAIQCVASAIRRKESGWQDDEHPLVFLFLGSSGIGKTELAKQVASYLHKDVTKGFIRVDMSEYQQKHEVSKFIGSPPGYVGHEEGGQLTKRLTESPNAVVLLDEVEKAHPDILTIMLQLFDEGRLTDGQGKTIECKNAIFIMTSNLASEEIADHAIQLREEVERVKKSRLDASTTSDPDAQVDIGNKFKIRVVQPILKRHFRRDEFLGRINEMVYFLPFSQPELRQLVNKELDIWKLKAEKRHKVELSWSEEVVDLLTHGYNVRYGARSIKHEVERRVVNQLADAYEKQLIKEGSSVALEVIQPNEEKSVPAIKMNIGISSNPSLLSISAIPFVSKLFS